MTSTASPRNPLSGLSKTNPLPEVIVQSLREAKGKGGIAAALAYLQATNRIDFLRIRLLTYLASHDYDVAKALARPNLDGTDEEQDLARLAVRDLLALGFGVGDVADIAGIPAARIDDEIASGRVGLTRHPLSAEILRLYSEGYTVAETVEKLGKSGTYIRHVLATAGVTDFHIQERKVDYPEDILEAFQLYRQGVSVPVLSERLGLHMSRAYYWIRKARDRGDLVREGD